MVEEAVPTSDFIAPDATSDGASYVRNTAVMTAGTALSRFTGFARTLVQAAALGVGASALADTYNRANTTPNILYELALGGVLTSVFVPLFVEWMKEHGKQEAWEVADRILTLTAVLLTAIAVIAAIVAPAIIRLYTASSHAADRQQQLEIGTFFLRWFMPQIVFYGVGAVAGGLLNANRRFAAPMFAPILNNLAVIATFGVYLAVLRGGAPSVAAITGTEKLVLGAGTTLGVIAMTLALWPSLRRIGYSWRPRMDWNHSAVRKLGRLSVWVAVYVVANQVALLIIIVLAGSVIGGFSAYSYAFVIFVLPHAIFVVSIFTALLPSMSARWTERDHAGLRELLSRGLRDTAVVIVPASLGLIALALPLSRLIFQHLHVSESDARLIARTLQGFAVGLPLFSCFQLLTRTFYAMQDTRTPALVNIAAATVNIAADVLFMKGLGWGIAGLALGQSVSYVFGTAALAVIGRRRLGGLDGSRIARSLARIVPVSALAALAAFGASVAIGSLGDGSGIWAAQVGAGSWTGVLVFVAAALIVKIDEVRNLAGTIRGRFR
jgi:putative peptidoglycan lipid II flippase